MGIENITSRLERILNGEFYMENQAGLPLEARLEQIAVCVKDLTRKGVTKPEVAATVRATLAAMGIDPLDLGPYQRLEIALELKREGVSGLEQEQIASPEKPDLPIT